MMERKDIRVAVQSVMPGWLGLQADLRFVSDGLATAAFVVFPFFLATQVGFAQTGNAGDAPSGSSPAAMTPLASSGVPSAPPAVLPVTKAKRVRDLDTLLAVRGGSAPITARQTDAANVAAALRGHAKDLEKPQPFRKKSTDLFRTQREVQIGNQEMQVRLRLRAKTRNAMSVELRF